MNESQLVTPDYSSFAAIANASTTSASQFGLSGNAANNNKPVQYAPYARNPDYYETKIGASKYDSKYQGKMDDVFNSIAGNTDLYNQLMPNWNTNLAQNNYYGNLNGKSFEETLALSRGADAINNRLHYTPSDVGVRGVGMHNAIQYNDPKQWDKIETQEMRQMRANEKIDEAVRARQANRQANVEDYPLELKKLVDQYNIRFKDSNMRRQMDMAFDSMWQNFLQDMDIQKGTRIYNFVKDMRGPMQQLFASLLSPGTVTPGVMQQLIYDAVDQYALQHNVDMGSALQIVLKGLIPTTTAMASSVMGGIGSSLFGGF